MKNEASASPELEALRYPIGRYDNTRPIRAGERAENVQFLADYPQRLAGLVADWPNERLDTPYRPDGWTVRQLVHHIADSHMNVYTRTKLALTEANPAIKPYNETAWATLPDSGLPIAPSLAMLQAIHERWVTILRNLNEQDWAKTYVHPAMNQTFTMLDMLGLYVWHSEHHYQHIGRLAKRNNWR